MNEIEAHHSVEEDPQETPSLAQTLTTDPVAPMSVRERIAAAAREKKEEESTSVLLPGWENVWITFKVLKDYEEVRDRFRARARRQSGSNAQREIGFAIETLLAASVDSYVLDGDARLDTGLPLGLELYDLLKPPVSENEERPRTDGEALILLFRNNTIRLTSYAGQLEAWFRDTSFVIGEELLGE